jgi:hypothetical protein
MKQLPKLSHMQFAILGELMAGSLAGREIRARLAKLGVRQGGPAFYQLMSRMEDAGLVSGSYEQEIVDSQIIRQRHYRIAAPGRSAWDHTRRFYARISTIGQPAKGAASG